MFYKFVFFTACIFYVSIWHFKQQLEAFGPAGRSGNEPFYDADDGDDVAAGPGGAARKGIGGKRSCLYIRGNLRCGFKHDEKTAIVRFVDSIKGVQDEGYSSMHGYFEVTGCVGTGAKPELHIVHKCKDGQTRRLKIFVPAGVSDEYNVTDIIDLKAHFTNEEAYDKKFEIPCDPF